MRMYHKIANDCNVSIHTYLYTQTLYIMKKIKLSKERDSIATIEGKLKNSKESTPGIHEHGFCGLFPEQLDVEI